MTATISFTFPASASYRDVLAAIDSHYDARSNIGDDAPDSGQRRAAEVFANTPGDGTITQPRSAAAVFTGQPQASSSAPLLNDGTIRDGEGYPWDERIHSSNKQMTSKGVWTKRKGVADNTHLTVRAELMQRGLVVIPGTPTQTAPAVTVTHAQTGHYDAADNSLTQLRLEKEARMAWATEQAMIRLGAYPGLAENFEKLKAGQMVTVAPHEAEYFNNYTHLLRQLFTDNAPAIPGVSAQPTGYLPPSPHQPTMQIPSHQQSPISNPGASPAIAALDPNTYPGFAVFVSTAMQQGRLTVEQLNQTIAQVGITDGVGLAAVGKHVDMIPALLALLDGFYQVRP